MKAISPSTAKIEPLFAAFCQPLINPENADSLSIGHSNIFNVQFDMDLKIRHVDNSGEEVLQSSLYNSNLYSILHPEDLNEMILNHQRCKYIPKIIISVTFTTILLLFLQL